ncbi:MAG: hypothetical protein WA743_04050 [Pseudolabrys sp.]
MPGDRGDQVHDLTDFGGRRFQAVDALVRGNGRVACIVGQRIGDTNLPIDFARGLGEFLGGAGDLVGVGLASCDLAASVSVLARMAASACAEALAPPRTDAAACSTSRIIALRSSSSRSMVSRIDVALLAPMTGAAADGGALAGDDTGTSGDCDGLLKRDSIKPYHSLNYGKFPVKTRRPVCPTPYLPTQI